MEQNKFETDFLDFSGMPENFGDLLAAKSESANAVTVALIMENKPSPYTVSFCIKKHLRIILCEGVLRLELFF